jgi:hypothetical protein
MCILKYERINCYLYYLNNWRRGAHAQCVSLSREAGNNSERQPNDFNHCRRLRTRLIILINVNVTRLIWNDELFY